MLATHNELVDDIMAMHHKLFMMSCELTELKFEHGEHGSVVIEHNRQTAIVRADCVALEQKLSYFYGLMVTRDGDLCDAHTGMKV